MFWLFLTQSWFLKNNALISFDRESDGSVKLVRQHLVAHFGHHRGPRADHRRAAHLLRHDADSQVEKAALG